MVLLASAQTTRVSHAFSQAGLLSGPVEGVSQAHHLQTQRSLYSFIHKTAGSLCFWSSCLEVGMDEMNSGVLFCSSPGFP